MAPMWSSCAWVSTSASTSSRRSSIRRRSGRIRSTPGSSWPGKSTPQSTISSRPRCSKTVMLRPISLMPPSAVTRNPPGASGPGGFRSASTSEVPWRRACQRPAPRSGPGWPAPAAIVDRRHRCLEAVVLLGHRHPAETALGVGQRRERHVDLAGGGHIARGERRQHVSELARRDMSPYADEPDRAHRQPGQVEGVVTRVVRQTGFGDDPAAAVQITLGVLDSDDVRVFGQCPDGVPLDGNARSNGNVVEQDRR